MLKSKQPSSRQAILLTSTSSFLGDVWLMKNVLHRTYNCEIKNFLINFKQKKITYQLTFENHHHIDRILFMLKMRALDVSWVKSYEWKVI